MFQDVRSVEQVASLEATRRKVKAAMAAQTTWEKAIMRIKDQYTARPRLAAGLALAAIAFAAVTMVPFSYTHTTGFRATISVAASQTSVSTNLIEGMLAAVGYENATVSTSSTSAGGSLTVSNLPSEGEAMVLAQVLAGVAGEDARTIVEPVKEKRSAPLYAQVARRVLTDQPARLKLTYRDGNLILDNETLNHNWADPDVPDGEVRRDLEEILGHYGLDSSQIAIRVNKNPDGTFRVIKVTVADDPVESDSSPSVAIHVAGDGDLFVTFDSIADSAQPLLLNLGSKRLGGKTVKIQVQLDTDNN
jgi:hypothetical protein